MRQRRLTAYFSTPLSSPVYSEHQRIIARHQGYFWPKVVVRERPLSAISGRSQVAATGEKRQLQASTKLAAAHSAFRNRIRL